MIISALTAAASLAATVISAVALWQTALNNDRESVGRLADRFNAAVEELSNSSSVASRQGGIISMEHIMREDDNWRPSVVEVIDAFVRDYRNSSAPRSCLDATLARPAADVQTALDVLGRRPHPDDTSVRPDLTGGDLRGFRLSGDYSRVVFRNASLFGADVRSAKLDRADLTGADLRCGRLSGTSLVGAALIRACLNKAALDGAIGIGADLSEATLRGADLSHADLTRAVLTNADFSRTVAFGLVPAGLPLFGVGNKDCADPPPPAAP